MEPPLDNSASALSGDDGGSGSSAPAIVAIVAFGVAVAVATTARIACRRARRKRGVGQPGFDTFLRGGLTREASTTSATTTVVAQTMGAAGIALHTVPIVVSCNGVGDAAVPRGATHHAATVHVLPGTPTDDDERKDGTGALPTTPPGKEAADGAEFVQI